MKHTTRLSTDLFSVRLRPCLYWGYEDLRDEDNETWDEFKDRLYKFYIGFLTGNMEDEDLVTIKHVAVVLKSLVITEKEGEKIQSPHYYNHWCDWINFNVNYDTIDLIDYVIIYKESIAKYIADKYTSCDGFISQTPNTIDTLIKSLADITDVEHDQAVGAVLSYVADTAEDMLSQTLSSFR